MQRSSRLTAAALAAVLIAPVVPIAATAAAAAEPAAATAAAPPNLALTATATASSTELDDARFVPAHVNDGDASTRWSSKYQDDNWVQLALAEPADVERVVIDWPNACARAFSIQTSVDGVTWTTQAERTSATCPRTDDIEIDAGGPVGFVRMQGAQRWSTWGYSIAEFAVYDQPLPEPEPQLPLVPQPVSVERGEGDYVLPRDAEVRATGEAAEAGEYLADVIRQSTGYDLPVVDEGDAAISIEVAPGSAPAGHEAEGYSLDVTADGIDIAADTAAGALNGVQTLRQLLPAWIESDTAVDLSWTVPVVAIDDYPRFEYRGFMIDTARSFYTVDEIKRIIDTTAPLKLNRLHLHLSDDQGWRLAIDTPEENPSGIEYGLLTEVSGATAMTYNGNGQLMGTELGHTGFYTKADYREIIDYAARNGMTVVPEIDLPGHTNAALHAIPQLNSAGSNPKPMPGESTAPHQGTGDVGISTFDANNANTYVFITEVLRQLAELTPGELLHIGGDEAHSTSRADYTKMVDFATSTVADLGKTVVGWNEYAGTALPEDAAVVQYWNGGTAAVANAVNTRGAKVILSPANKTYMPQKQDARQPLGGTWACGSPCTLENAYNWNPGTQIAGISEQDVLGVEAAVWGEFIRGVGQAQFYSFPRLLATAEAGWTPQARKNTAEFLERVGASGPRMAASGVNFFPTATVDWSASAAPVVTARPVTATPEAAGDAPTASRLAVDWRVSAPGATATSLSAELVWDDGVRERVALTASTAVDIAGMTNSTEFAGSSRRNFHTSGVHVGHLRLMGDGDPVVAGSIAVTVPGRR